MEHYLSFDVEMNQELGFKLIKMEEVPHYMKEAKRFWRLNYEGSYQEYTEEI